MRTVSFLLTKISWKYSPNSSSISKTIKDRPRNLLEFDCFPLLSFKGIRMGTEDLISWNFYFIGWNDVLLNVFFFFFKQYRSHHSQFRLWIIEIRAGKLLGYRTCNPINRAACTRIVVQSRFDTVITIFTVLCRSRRGRGGGKIDYFLHLNSAAKIREKLNISNARNNRKWEISNFSKRKKEVEE